MPDPTNTDEHECQRCHDTGMVPGTYNVCRCITGTDKDEPRWTAS